VGLVPHTPRGALSAGTRVGRYELLRRLARGGMAELYLARAVGIHGFEKLCVLKLVLPHLAEDREFAEMFLREARIAAGLDHPNIAHVSDIGEINGEPFFVMQYIHGRDLRAISKSLDGKAMPLDAALTIASSIAAGLHYVHERRGPDGRALGLVHRDVSPSNVMVGYDGDVKLVDFGIAKSSEQRSATRTGVLKGKVNYMAPEQCHGRPVDRRTDVFALGILLYEMTTGTRMFAGDNDFYVMTKIVRGVWAQPSEVAEGFPEALTRIIARALQVEPEDRYPSAQAIQVDLEAFAQAQGLRISPLSLAGFMKSEFGEQILPEAVDPLDVAPTEIRFPEDGPVPFPPDPSSTRIGPGDVGRGVSRVTSLGVTGGPSLRLLRDDTKIGGATRHPRADVTGIVVGELVDGDDGEDDETRAHPKEEPPETNADGEDETTRIAPRRGDTRLGAPTPRTLDGPPTATVVLGRAEVEREPVDATEVLTRAPERAPEEPTLIATAPAEHPDVTEIARVSGELYVSGDGPASGPHSMVGPAPTGYAGSPMHSMPVAVSSGALTGPRARISGGRAIAWAMAAIVAVALGTLTAAALSGDEPAPDTAALPEASAEPAVTPAIDPGPSPTDSPPDSAPDSPQIGAAPTPSPTEAETPTPTLDPVPPTPAPEPDTPAIEPSADTPPDEPIVVDDTPQGPAKGSRTRRSKRRPNKSGKPRGSGKQRLNDSMYPSG
jgi:serine/threonine protein kinase